MKKKLFYIFSAKNSGLYNNMKIDQKHMLLKTERNEMNKKWEKNNIIKFDHKSTRKDIDFWPKRGKQR